MKDIGARWKNALAGIVLVAAFFVSFTPSVSRAVFEESGMFCATYWGPSAGFFPCWDMTFGFLTPGMCVAQNVCLGLGTVAITGAAIGIGKGIVSSILGGGNGNSGSG